MISDPEQNSGVIDLRHSSSDFDPTYGVLARTIPAVFLEDRSFLRNRLRVRDEGPKTEKEKALVQDGYSLHLLAAKLDKKVVGAIYGHLISGVGNDNRAIGFVTYIAILPEHRRKGMGSRLISALHDRLQVDSLRLTGKPLAGMVYEIEEEGKEEIKGLLRKFNCWPLDIDYYQPALHASTSAEPMLLWFQPLAPPLESINDASKVMFPVDFIKSLVLNLLTMEYVGPEMNGFDPASKPFTEFLKSLGSRTELGFRV